MINLIPEIIVVLLSYLIGSFPTAYAVLKNHAQITEGKEIREVKNVWFVMPTRTAITFLAIDVLKGMAAVWIALVLFGENFFLETSAAVSAVLGNNYSPWFGFKGGRGLAIAAGTLIFIAWSLVIVWSIFWVVGKITLKNSDLASGFALILVPLLIAILPNPIIASFINASPGAVRVFVFILCSLVLLKHLKPIWKALVHPESYGRS
ncbi:MAG: glycerol-3-phosphate acyltransferase [Bacteroidota bacterium]